MSIQEKFAGFNYQDHQKYHQEAVEKYGQEVMYLSLIHILYLYNKSFKDLIVLKEYFKIRFSKNERGFENV